MIPPLPPAAPPIGRNPLPTAGASVGIPGPRTGGAADASKLLESARAFEAMAIGALLAPMFETIDLSKGPFGGGAGEAAWKPMMIEEMAKKISQGGGLGLARSIHEALLRAQEDKSS